ncbi:MAG: hypothetical protein JWN64_556 [Parcubacteria group bacterium]|nr:hypothetical protein [Parcubacteria group bacterium]
MAGSSPRTVSIIIASVIAVVLVGGAYATSGPIPFLGKTNVADAESSAELLKSYAAKDTDGDQLPDWQEALYGTDPNNPESVRKGTKDGDAVSQGLVKPKVLTATSTSLVNTPVPGVNAGPTTVTDRFARSLLTQYLKTRGPTPPTPAELSAFVEQGLQSFKAEEIETDTYSTSDIVAGGSGADALATYAANLEQVFATYTVPTDKTDLEYFSDAVSKNDSSAITKLFAISKSYAAIARAAMKLSVPSEARNAHLSIANALMHMSETTADMAATKTDPVLAVFGIGMYQERGANLGRAFANLNGVFDAVGANIPDGTSGASIVQVAKRAADAVANEQP